jgi:hypothetical protein
MTQPVWNFEQEPWEGGEQPDETSYNLRAYFDRMDDAKMREYQDSWTDEELRAWDGNFKEGDEDDLFLICSERGVDTGEYRRVLHQAIQYRNRARAELVGV